MLNSLEGLLTKFKEIRQQNSKPPEVAAAATQQCEPCLLQKEIDDLRCAQSQQTQTLQALIVELMTNIVQQDPGMDQNSALATQTTEPLPWEIEGISPADRAS